MWILLAFCKSWVNNESQDTKPKCLGFSKVVISKFTPMTGKQVTTDEFYSVSR